MTKHFVRSPYNYDRDQASRESGLECKDKSLARQEFAEESNINYIADRYGLTGEMPQVLRLPAYGDFTGIFDFQSAQNQVRQAMEGFMTLPAKLRARFHNNPQELLEFLGDPENRPEAERLGLVNKPSEATTMAAVPSTDTKGAPLAPAAPPAGPTPVKTDTK